MSYLKNHKFKKHIIHALKILRVFVIVILVLFLTLYLWGSTNHQKIEGEITYQNSSSYKFNQNPITRWITVTYEGKVIHSFFFWPQVFAAWADKDSPLLLLITSDTGTLKGAQGLYIYNGNNIKKVYQSSSVEFESGLKSSSYIYSYWLNTEYKKLNSAESLNKKRKELNQVFTTSPDKKYLFGYESGYEGGTGFIINLDKFQKIPLEINSSEYNWSTSLKCATTYEYFYGDIQKFQLLYYKDGNLSTKSFKNNFILSQFVRTLWFGKRCEGIVELKSEYDTNGNSDMERTFYYYFNLEEDNLKQLPTITTINMTESINSPQFLQNIFFTIQDKIDYTK